MGGHRSPGNGRRGCCRTALHRVRHGRRTGSGSTNTPGRSPGSTADLPNTPSGSGGATGGTHWESSHVRFRKRYRRYRSDEGPGGRWTSGRTPGGVEPRVHPNEVAVGREPAPDEHSGETSRGTPSRSSLNRAQRCRTPEASRGEPDASYRNRLRPRRTPESIAWHRAGVRLTIPPPARLDRNPDRHGDRRAYPPMEGAAGVG